MSSEHLSGKNSLKSSSTEESDYYYDAVSQSSPISLSKNNVNNYFEVRKYFYYAAIFQNYILNATFL